ncbi:MAG: alpha/beta hydrolase [Methanobrevibacter sp.]|uniref:alpha/beta fold hydrolase n=1 Tax=Methanobrevibacter sp. TaxID=66852 RepID=UPI0025E890D3|nr:alpha/beta hydrolase [Methanobrevibacter sp.]MBE6508867.1 alpha/beta hydrolase [Methanobrevibacter sp.]
MNYKLEGSGETLVFIHGLSDNLLYWELLASDLKKSYQILRIDLRGHGGSELGSDEITLDTYVQDLKNLLDELKIQNVNLIGFSLGGIVALDFIRRYPEAVSSLVLMSSFYKVDSPLEDVFAQFRNALEKSFGEFYDLILPMVLCPEVIENNREELKFLKEIASETANTEAYIKAIDASSNVNFERLLSQIDVPTLILAGKYDEITSLDSQKDLQSKVKNSRIIIFDDTKHNLLVGKNNVEIIGILKNFYKKRNEE